MGKTGDPLKPLWKILRAPRPTGMHIQNRGVIMRVVEQCYPQLQPQFTHDYFGNMWATIGTGGDLFIAHMDTVDSVSHAGATKPLFINNAGVVNLGVNPPKGMCLGADDGAGVWLLLELMNAGVAGTYVLTVGEESGRHGMQHLMMTKPELFEGHTLCVSFDRRGTTDILTHQCGARVASDEAALALSEAIGIPRLTPSPDGAFTDNELLAGEVSEIFNVSCGYADAHTNKESLDTVFLTSLRDALLRVDWGSIPRVRTPGVGDPWEDFEEEPIDLEEICWSQPGDVARFLEQYGLEDDLRNYIGGYTYEHKRKRWRW